MDDNLLMDRPRSSSRSRSRSRSNVRSRARSRSNSRSRRRSRSSGFLGISNLPTWVPISLGIVSVCGLVYGLMQLDTVSDFMDPMIHDVGEFFGLTDEEGIDSTNITHDRMYSGIGS